VDLETYDQDYQEEDGEFNDGNDDLIDEHRV
jgi:hypothetical protein